MAEKAEWPDAADFVAGEALGVGGRELVIAKNPHGYPQLAEILDQVEGEGIVVVYD